MISTSLPRQRSSTRPPRPIDDLRNIELRHLNLLAVIAETGTITAAARRLGISQPSLSQQLKLLERRVGTTLFDRTTTGMRLTPSGEVLLASVNRATEELRTGLALARNQPLRVRIGLPLDIPQAALSEIDRQLTTRHAITPTYVPADPTTQVAQLRSGRFDFAVLRLPTDLRGLVAHPLTENSPEASLALITRANSNWSRLLESWTEDPKV
ncbi:LysR family transcriptional regulator [Nocardia sp. NPDC088792]|uniref:LysR family transcriptional regulator n=1 Tax=Nocardia sp. NPDC088792 TaxID=3364332 RepID=UPI0037F1F8DB